MKVGLVLGAGGVQGGAWLTGGLEALAREGGWDPAAADYIVGTSAGSMLGTLIAAGLPPWFMVAHSRGESFKAMRDVRGEPQEDADRAAGAELRPEPGAIPLFPGSPALALRTLARPLRHTPASVLSAWLPRGIISAEPLRDIVRRTVAGEWTEHPNHWVVACDYATGRRVCFGRQDAPPARIEEAVAASCSVPGLYRPVMIGGRRYVDGGIWSTSNLDVLCGQGLDLVICLNPTSTLHPLRAANPGDIGRLVFNRESGRRLGREARRLRDEGTKVILVQPLERDLEAMGVNLMSRKGRNRVIATAQETVARQLREPEAAELLAGLPAGDPDVVGRPRRPQSEWPGLDDLGARVGRAPAPA